MPSNVINLRQARKQRERAARRQHADENRARHGRTRAERAQAVRDAEEKARRLDGHWLDQGDADAIPEPGRSPGPEQGRDES